jgi:peptide/nickel transport system permease protein
MLGYVVRRLIHGIIVLAVVMVVVFLIFQVLGDPVRKILPTNVTDEQVAAFRQANGFNDPVLERFIRFVGDVMSLNFGKSYTLHRESFPVVMAALPHTFILAGCAFVVGLLIAAILGSIAALHHGSGVDRGIVAFGTVLASVPEFWVGLLLIVYVAVRAAHLPTSGYGINAHLILPVATLALAPIGRLTSVIRTSTLDVLREQHVLVATARGLPRRTVLGQYVLRNASVPTIAMGTMELTRLLVGGAVVVETVFAWPGIGQLYVQGMAAFDLPLITATVFIATVLVLVLNLGVDIFYTYVDPRVRYGNG